METAARRHVAAGVALVGATVIAAAPVMPPPPAPPTPHALHVANLDPVLTASVANIPVNLAYAAANVTYNQVQAINHIAASLFFTGNWFVSSATNVWGTDAADPGHFESVIALMAPYPALSEPLAHQQAMIAAAVLPASSSCDAETCYPLTPVVPITGIRQLDWLLHFGGAVAGLESLPLIQNWGKVSFADLLAGYTFPTVVSPSGAVHDATYGDYYWEGTHTDPETGEELLPWSGTTFKWEPLAPWINFYDSLTQEPPPLSGAVKIATAQDVVYAFQALAAGLIVGFNPYVPGSPFCEARCDIPGVLTTREMVEGIRDSFPGNPMIGQWLQDEEQGTANGPTQEQIDASIRLIQVGFFNFDPDTTNKINTALANVHPLLPDIVRNAGLLEGYRVNADGELEQYGGLNRKLLAADVNRLFGISEPSDIAPDVSSIAASRSGAGTQAVSSTSVIQSLASLALPVADRQAAKRLFTRPAEKAPAHGAVVPASTDPEPGQTTDRADKPVERLKPFARLKAKLTDSSGALSTATTPTDVTGDGGTAEPKKVRGDATRPRGALKGVLRSAADQVSSGISKVTGGLKDGVKAGAPSPDGAEAGAPGTREGEAKAGSRGEAGKAGSRGEAGKARTPGGKRGKGAGAGSKDQS